MFPVLIPPLRERRDDLPLLLAHFLGFFNDRHGRSVAGFSHPATKLLLAYDYPGNIRELQNLVERGVVYADDHGQIDVHHLFTGNERLPESALGLSDEGYVRSMSGSRVNIVEKPGSRTSDSLTDLRRIELEIYASAVANAGGNLSAAARALGVTRAKLEYRLKQSEVADARDLS